MNINLDQKVLCTWPVEHLVIQQHVFVQISPFSKTLTHNRINNKNNLQK